MSTHEKMKKKEAGKNKETTKNKETNTKKKKEVLIENEKSKKPEKVEIEDEDEEKMKQHAQNDLSRLTVSICILLFISFILGYFQCSFLTPFILCAYAIWTWRVKTGRVFDWFYREHEMREHRKRALEQAETVEWFNYLLNRWWVFSDSTLFQILKKGVDPVLQSTKPKIVESIELEKFTLGNRTPYFKYLRVYDMSDDLRKLMASDVTYRNPPKDLMIRPKYQVAIDADMGLDAPDSNMTIRLKLASKLGGETDVCIEKFQLRGRVQLVLFFNQNIPFPHLAAFSISFLTVPKVNFEIRMLKKIQLMEFPMIRNWIQELVNDSLKISLVDPGHVTIPLCNDPEVLGRQTGYASGVLTLTLKGGAQGKATSDDQWCSITLGKQKIRTKEIDADVQWQEQISMLVHSLQYDKLRIKIKGKRRFGPNYTVVEYVLPLIRLDLEQECEQEMTLQNETVEGSQLTVMFNYSSLPVLNVSNEIDSETFTKSYIEKNDEQEPDEVSGVLFVRVHKGINLIPMDSNGTSDPYVMIFANKDLVQMGHVVEENLNPEWDTMIEFFTIDYTQTTVSLVVHDHDAMVLPTVLLADDNDDFMGSCNLALTKADWCVFKREVDLLFKFPGNMLKGQQECLKKVGKLEVSVIFRPISSLKTSIRGTPNMGMEEGQPLHQKRTKIDAVTMEAILCTERGSLTICILRSRNLVALDLNGRSDPFVTVCVGDSKQEKFKTKVVYRTLNPVWNEQITLAMPQKHQKISLIVWDKDPFTQEKMGILRFSYDDLVNLGDGAGVNDKHWFDLEQAKSGEIQLSFKVELPQKHENSTKEDERTESFMYNSDDSDDYLVVDNNANKEKLSKSMIHMNGANGSTSPNDSIGSTSPTFASKSLDLTDAMPVISEGGDIVDFSGEPSKYFGLYGKILEVIGLKTNSDIDEVYVKLKLDRHAKFQQPARRSILGKSERVLCRTAYVQVQERIPFTETFQTKVDNGVSPCIFLIFEVKSEKKGKDVIDSHSMLLRNFFKGENPTTRIVELDNGGKMKVELGHVINEKQNASMRKKLVRRNSRLPSS